MVGVEIERLSIRRRMSTMKLLRNGVVLWRSFGSRHFLSTQQLVYEEHGDPPKVLKMRQCELKADALGGDEVLVRWLAAPVNPADINQIQGVYPVKPALPAVGGNEGCGIVERVGARVDGGTLAVGDSVIPTRSGLGTWTEFGVYAAERLYRVAGARDERPSLKFAATIQVNPSTAYRMLHDFVRLNAGDCVLQNGANSSVGRYVIQIARILKLRTINVVRNRDSIDELKTELKNLGADQVYTEEEFGDAVRSLRGAAQLALNCVGGRSALNVTRALSKRACVVTYGGMSKQPLATPTGSLIFDDVTLRGFWMSRWYEINGHSEERKQMYSRLFEWARTGELCTPPMRERAFDAQFADAFADGGGKTLFFINKI